MTQESRDSNMSIVDSLVRDAIQSEYDIPAQVAVHPWTKPIGVAVVSLCVFLLVFAGFRASAGESAVNEERQALIQRIEQRATALAAAESALTSSREAIDALQLAQLNATGQGGALATRIADLEIKAGLSQAYGQGMIVTVQDSPDADSLNPAVDRVLDQDLQAVVNGLWQAGASAIAINGSRLTSTSAIRSAGIAILVDYRPLNPPYEISAVATTDLSAEDFATRFARTAAAQLLRDLRTNYRIESTVQERTSLTVPAATSVRGSR